MAPAFPCSFFCTLTILILTSPILAIEADTSSTCQQFEAYSGAQLVFRRADLPPGKYHDFMKPLCENQQATAAAACLNEVRKYPPNFLGEVGMRKIGLFAACISRAGDGFRAFDQELGGYRYFGTYNGTDAAAVACYDTDQLAMTFHHEIFHHIDSTHRGLTESWQLSSDDAVYFAAISGLGPYAPPTVGAEDLVRLRARCHGFTLQDAVSPYAAKNAQEDQAETARYLMLRLPDAIVQLIDAPELAGSQRILHVLKEYERSIPDGPRLDWFVDVALQRSSPLPQQILNELQAVTQQGLNDPQRVRICLQQVSHLDPTTTPAQIGTDLMKLSAKLTQDLLIERIRPDTQQERFAMWGPEDANGVNWHLRADVNRFATDAIRLKRIWQANSQQPDLLTRTQMQSLRLLARYYKYIAANWSVTPGTQQVFESARNTIADSLPPNQEALINFVKASDLIELASLISETGEIAKSAS